MGVETLNEALSPTKISGELYRDLVEGFMPYFDVDPFPYNWLESYGATGDRLAARIDELLD